jgi:hypothetical protein
MQKHRIIYKCSAILPDFEYAPGNMQMGDMEKIEELTVLSEGFANEYYGDKYEAENSVWNYGRFYLVQWPNP